MRRQSAGHSEFVPSDRDSSGDTEEWKVGAVQLGSDRDLECDRFLALVRDGSELLDAFLRMYQK